MGVSIILPVDCMWNGRADLQAGVEIYHWGYLRFWLILGNQNDPLFMGPNFTPPCGQLAVQYLFVYGEPGPDFISCT